MVGMFIGWFYKKFMFVLLIGSYKKKRNQMLKVLKLIFFSETVSATD
jgi:hypothetical protein